MGISLEEARAVYERRRAAWLAEDIEAYLGCFAEDVVLETPTRTVHGHAEYEPMTRMSFDWAKPVSFDFHNLAVGDDNVVMCDWTISVKRRSDGGEVTWRGMNVCELRDGVIVWWREYYDDPAALAAAARAPRNPDWRNVAGRMDLTFTPEEEMFRAECRAWLEANVPRGLPSGDTRDGFAAHLEWERALFDARYAVVSWPEEYGGRGASAMEWLIFEEEYYRAGGPQRVTQNGIFLLAPTVFEFGTQEQKDRILPRMAAAQDLWCQGWSEPNAGSDLAGIQSKAVRDDAAGGWRLSGQKTWTTRGAFCTHLFGLFRSDPDADRHRGLTYFLVPLDAQGMTVRGFGRLDGDEGFAEVFLDDVFVPDADVLGDVHQGWGVAMATTSSERGLTLRSPGRFTATASRLVDLWRERADADDSRLRDEVVRAWTDAEAYRWQTFLTVTRMGNGEQLGAESSMTKVFWSDLDVRMHELALEILGANAEHDESGWMKGYQFALSGPIYAGTNEIQRNVIAERVLGLPRK